MLSIRWLIPVSILSVLLAGCGDKNVEKEVQALKSESPEERASAALHLGKMGDKATKAAPELVKLLEDPEPKVRAAAAVALGGMKVQDEKVVAALVVATEESPPEVQTSAMMSLQALEADSDLVQVSIRMLNSASAEVRLNATLRLIELKKKAEPAIPALM